MTAKDEEFEQYLEDERAYERKKVRDVRMVHCRYCTEDIAYSPECSTMCEHGRIVAASLRRISDQLGG